MGLSKDAVKNCVQRDGKDPSIMDLDPNKSLNSQINKNNELQLKDNPEYTKYFKMIKMGLSKDAVKNCVQRDGKDPSIMDLDPNKSLNSQINKNNELQLKDNPEYTKYFKMIKMGLSKDAVKNCIQRDGKDPSCINFLFNSKLKSSHPDNITYKPINKPKIRRKKIFWNAM